MDDLGLQQTPLSPATASATAGQPSAPPVQPETPVITPPKKKFPFKPVIGTLVALLLVSGTVFLSRQLIQQRQTVEQQAALPGTCKNRPKDQCNGCGPVKNDKQYECKWDYKDDGCREGKECVDGKPPLSCDDLITDCTDSCSIGGGTPPGPDGCYKCGGYNGNSEFCIKGSSQYTCFQVGVACKDWSLNTGCPTTPVNTYYCKGVTAFVPGGCAENDPLPGGVHYFNTTNTIAGPCGITGNWCGEIQVDQIKNASGQDCTNHDIPGCNSYEQLDDNCDENPPASPSPSPSPTATIPDCTSLTTTADLNNLKIGTEYSFQLTAGGTAPITGVRMSTYGNSCSDNPSDDPQTVAGPASGPGTYTIKWTPAKAGPFTAYGRIWNDGIAECRADCVDGPPRYLCPNAQACKLTGTVITDSIMSCVDLTKNIVAPKLNDTVTFTCKGANFSSAAPVAQFRTNLGGATFLKPFKPIALVNNQATTQIPISAVGNWLVQCRVCTDYDHTIVDNNDTNTYCTNWGQAN